MIVDAAVAVSKCQSQCRPEAGSSPRVIDAARSMKELYGLLCAASEFFQIKHPKGA
jgi:hypothetical protein